MEIHDNILETLGNTPLVRLNRFLPQGPVLAAKIESFNPGSSVKDRIAPALIEAGERDGLLRPGGIIVEPTSGNTGLGLALAAVLKGYRLICTAPDKIPAEKVALLEALGSPHLACPTTVISGTNGKGSVAAMLAAIGRAAGHRIGVYTSPHLSRLEERFQIDGSRISPSGLDFHLGAVFPPVSRQLPPAHLP